MEREQDDPANNSVIGGDFARVPFLHDGAELGLYTVARLKNNLPELLVVGQFDVEAALRRHLAR